MLSDPTIGTHYIQNYFLMTRHTIQDLRSSKILCRVSSLFLIFNKLKRIERVIQQVTEPNLLSSSGSVWISRLFRCCRNSWGNRIASNRDLLIPPLSATFWTLSTIDKSSSIFRHLLKRDHNLDSTVSWVTRIEVSHLALLFPYCPCPVNYLIVWTTKGNKNRSRTNRSVKSFVLDSLVIIQSWSWFHWKAISLAFAEYLEFLLCLAFDQIEQDSLFEVKSFSFEELCDLGETFSDRLASWPLFFTPRS